MNSQKITLNCSLKNYIFDKLQTRRKKVSAGMIVYKFKDLKTCKSVLRVIRTIRSGKIYCSKISDLNDPIEAVLNYKYRNDENRLKRIMENIRQNRIASFSSRRNIPLMWFHYADGGRGCCIEYELDEKLLESVNYSLSWIEDSTQFDEDAIIKKVLLSKHPDWNYEEEIRHISPSGSYIIGRVTNLYVGKRCNDRTFSLLKLTCKTRQIPVSTIEFLPLEGDLREVASCPLQ